MQYKVVPLEFNIDIKKSSTSKEASDYLERFINHYENQGWIYIRVEVISAYVSGESGCFGLGATSGYTTTKQMVVFKK